MCPLFNAHVLLSFFIFYNRKPEMKNIVLFPFMAQGHIIPFLSLALKLQARENCTITFVNTPQNIKKLQNYHSHLSNISLVEIPFESELGMESTETLPRQEIVRLLESSISLKPAFRNLISNLVAEQNRGKTLVFCIISDMFFAWSADIAHEFGLVHAIFNAGGGYGMAGWHTLWLNLPHLKSESGEFNLPGFPVGKRFKTKNLTPDMRAAESSWQFLTDTFGDWETTDAMLFNTVEEIDQTGLYYFKEQFPSCSVYALGPILSPFGSIANGGEVGDATRSLCLNWLDSKPENSVLYIAFGSQNSPSDSQILEIAKALDYSNVNFLWVLRPLLKTDLADKYAERDWFPTGFEERIHESGKGMLLKKWAPQMDILSHKSVGAFLTHCGWNSIMEALGNGVPMLSWPMGSEQPFNADFLEGEMRVSVGMGNGVDCEVKYEEVARKIELMMKDGGNLMRRKAREVMEIIRNVTIDEGDCKGSSVRAMDDFLNMVEERRFGKVNNNV